MVLDVGCEFRDRGSIPSELKLQDNFHSIDYLRWRNNQDSRNIFINCNSLSTTIREVRMFRTSWRYQEFKRNYFYCNIYHFSENNLKPAPGEYWIENLNITKAADKLYIRLYTADCFKDIPLLSIKSFSRVSMDNLTSIDQETFTLNSNKVVVTRTQKASGSLSGTFDLTLQMMNGTTLVAKGRLCTLFCLFLVMREKKLKICFHWSIIYCISWVWMKK